MKPLEAGKSTIFLSPLEDDQVYVRTGVPETDSLSHAFLLASHVKYPLASNEQKAQAIELFKKRMLADIDTGAETTQTVMADRSYQTISIEMFRGFVQAIATGKTVRSSPHVRKLVHSLVTSRTDSSVYEIIFELVGERVIEACITNELNAMRVKGEFDQDRLIRMLKKKVTTALFDLSVEQKKKDYCGIKFERLCQEVLDATFLEVSSSLNLVASETESLIKGVTAKTSWHLFVLETDGIPRPSTFNLPDDKETKNRYVVLVHLGGDRYELVGQLVNSNSILREFGHDHDLIHKIKAMLFFPNSIRRYYPRLSKYLTSVRLSESDLRTEQAFEQRMIDRVEHHSGHSDRSSRESDQYLDSDDAGNPDPDARSESGDSREKSEDDEEEGDTTEPEEESDDESIASARVPISTPSPIRASGSVVPISKHAHRRS